MRGQRHAAGKYIGSGGDGGNKNNGRGDGEDGVPTAEDPLPGVILSSIPEIFRKQIGENFKTYGRKSRAQSQSNKSASEKCSVVIVIVVVDAVAVVVVVVVVVVVALSMEKQLVRVSLERCESYRR